jgi:uncharacterized membrane protein YdcZ (DUF606 family)
MWASTVLAVAIGALLAVQAVLNARVSALLGRPIHAALLSFAVGMVSLLGRVLGQRVNCASSGFPAASSSLSRGPRRAYGPACGRS